MASTTRRQTKFGYHRLSWEGSVSVFLSILVPRLPLVAFVVIQSTFEGHSINTADKLQPTAAKYDLPIPFGQSAGKGTPPIMQKYRTRGTPWVVLIDKTGVVQFNGFHLEPEKAAGAIEQLKIR